ncbi:hypothetical protein [Rhizobium sp. MHM7A]|uniref:hypothetical protein n=1 Tax=Rhizobium sp. MHM7A TaxID=2583233 RepID=UPI00110605FD|nr:hypothetical protein [Rhizobium sp. MHM7A]TLX12283.1 hypothetical protein FFR93_17170 [Rhizobium sp. MHM7A]
MYRLTILAIPILLTGCRTAEPYDPVYSTQIPPTAAERSAVIDYARKTYYNEREIRDVSISKVLTLSGGERIICIRFKAKNQLTEPAGVTTESLRFDQRYGFALGGSLHHDYLCNPRWLHYYPVAELEN